MLPVPGADRRSRAGRSRKVDLRRLPSRRIADTGVPAMAQVSPQAKVPDLTGRVRCRGC